MDEMTEQIYLEFGLEPPAADPGNGSTPAAAEQQGQGADAGTREHPPGGGAAANAGTRENPQGGGSAADAGTAGTSRQGAAEASPEGSSETDPEGLSEEQRRDNAGRRRRQEQDLAVRRAVEAALAEQRKKNDAEWASFFREAKLKSDTGEDIRTREDFGKWRQDHAARQLERDLKAGKLTPEALDQAIGQHPVMQKAQQLLEQQEAEAQREKEKAAWEKTMAKTERQLAEIGKIDPSIRSLEDLAKTDQYDAILAYVRRGYDLADAYYLLNREEIAARQAAAARQQALNSVNGQAHLTAAAVRGEGTEPVPRDVLEIYRAMNPGVSDEEITRHWNRSRKK